LEGLFAPFACYLPGRFVSGDDPSPKRSASINNPGTLQIALQRHRRSAASFQHLAFFPQKADFSCFGNHPDLESRLTFQRKWVLVSLEVRQMIREMSIANPL
jgi:hypothetical protein